MPSLSRRPGPGETAGSSIGARGFEHRLRVNTHLIKDHRQLVNQANIQIALGVLNHFSGFGDPDAGRVVRAGGDDVPIQRIHDLGDLGRRPRGHLLGGASNLQRH